MKLFLISRRSFSGLLLVLLIFIGSFRFTSRSEQIRGAWMRQSATVEEALLLCDGYFMQTVYDRSTPKMSYSRGGTFQFDGKSLKVRVEFHSHVKEQVGQTLTFSFQPNGQQLLSDIGGERYAWTRVDKAEGPMAGNWRISGRMEDGKITSIPKRARKTLKLLTDSRFQWAAINSETGEFFGTGGGTYTFKDGKYTETIEFFSRDSSRVGASLSFDGKLENDLWHHSGLSSRGLPIYEIWEKE